MAHIDALIEKVADPALREALRQQVNTLMSKRTFGLVFQEHKPETVELPDYPVCRNCKVRVRDEPDHQLYRVIKIEGGKATIRSLSDQPKVRKIAPAGLVVVREFGEAIYPGLKSLGRVERGVDKPTHIVVNAENFHALETLLYTHEAKVDAIYIDPPYNTGARDWKYNNDYVDGLDAYRHSKWLAFMERRLQLARRLLNPDRSVLIVTVDDNEVNRLGLLLEQVFVGHTIQMVTSVINPRGQYRFGEFSRCDEYIYFVTIGTAHVAGEPDEDYSEGADIAWRTFRRSDITSARGTLKGGTSQFYPIYVNNKSRRIEQIGSPLAPETDRRTVPERLGCTAVFPIRDDGTEMNWGLTPETANGLLKRGYLRVGKNSPSKPQAFEISYLTSGRIADIEQGRARITGHDETGAVIASYVTSKLRMPLTTWTKASHNAETGGTNLLKSLLGEKAFPYPKSLYAVEDALRFFIGDDPNAVVLDFFGGSGTTTHAVARLNRQDGGRRQSILITNNEVSDAEVKALQTKGLYPGDVEWEQMGICSYITIPRLMAAFTGKDRSGADLVGSYNYADKSPMASGFEENIEFFQLTYENPDLVSLGRKFKAVAPLLWLKAGAEGTRIESISGSWTLPEDAHYGVLFVADEWRAFVQNVARRADIAHVFIVTDSEAIFQQISSELPTQVQATQLYEDYLRTFEINTKGRS